MPSQFAQRYLKEGRLVYVHDDSETETDTFEFVVSNKTHSNITSGKFFIEVTMKNDNPPTRQVEKPFNVIRYGEKPLLGSDFRYLDADMNTSAGSITYTNTYIPNGQLFFLNGTSANSGFTQADLDQGHILFRHNGSDLAKAEIWVSDGQFYLSGAMEIRASDPYIRVINNTGIVVKYGTNRLITASNLAIESNLDLSNKSSIIFKIIAEPRLGVILVAETEATQFTMEVRENGKGIGQYNGKYNWSYYRNWKMNWCSTKVQSLTSPQSARWTTLASEVSPPPPCVRHSNLKDGNEHYLIQF